MKHLVPLCVCVFIEKAEIDRYVTKSIFFMFPQSPFYKIHKNTHYAIYISASAVHRQTHNQGLPLQADCSVQQQAAQSLTDNMLSRNASFVIADAQNYFPWKPKI